MFKYHHNQKMKVKPFTFFFSIPLLERNNHREFLLKGLKTLSQSYQVSSFNILTLFGFRMRKVKAINSLSVVPFISQTNIFDGSF